MNPTSNPYAPVTISEPVIKRVKIRPIELLGRAFEMIRGDYWLFLGITLAAMLIGSLVPLGILLGPMMVGVFHCYSERQQSGRTEFGTVMKGFDQFVDALIATLVMVVVSIVVLIPVIIVYVVLAIIVLGIGDQPVGPNAPVAMPSNLAIASLLTFYPMMIFINLVIYIPFLFTFQLIADRRLTGLAAVRASARGSWQNLGGVSYFLIVLFFIWLLAMIPCFVPVILLMPISIGATWVLYQDIFGTAPQADSSPPA